MKRHPAGAEKVGGIVLCGGQSRRMGRPKHTLPFGQELLIERIIRIVGGAVSPVVVVAAADQVLPPLPPTVLIARDQVAGQGPLAGIAAGLEALPEECVAAYVCACDVPLLHTSVVRRLVDARGLHDLVIPRDAKFLHPLSAVYRRDLLPTICRLLQSNQRRLASLVGECDSLVVDVDSLRDLDPHLESFRNINTPEEYADALAVAGLKVH